MHGTGDLTGLALVMGAALLCGLGMRRLGQPPIVGYILAGVILGPSALGLVGDRGAVTLLAELGVLLLLFLVAMEMSLFAFREVWRVSAAATVLQIAASFAVMVPAVLLGGATWKEAAVLGFVVSLSSTAVVIKMLEQTNILRQPVGSLVIGILIAQDLAVVPLLIGINLLGEGTFNPWTALKFAAAAAAVAALVWFLARRKRLVIPMIREGTPGELVALAGLAFCFGAAAITGYIGLTPALGAFLAGLVIGNSTARHPTIVSTRPIQGVLLMVFFLSIGLLIDFKFLAGHWGVLLALLFAVTVVKTLLNIGILALLREPWPHAFVAGVLLAQIGEFSLVLAGTAERARIISSELGQTIVAVIAFSLLLAPLWLFTTRRLLRVIILGVTSFNETLAAIRSRRLAAAWSAMAHAARWGGRGAARLGGGLGRGVARVGSGVARLLPRKRPKPDFTGEADPDPTTPRRRKGDTLTPDRHRGVAAVPDAPEAPRYPPPGETSPGAPESNDPPQPPRGYSVERRTGPPRALATADAHDTPPIEAHAAAPEASSAGTHEPPPAEVPEPSPSHLTEPAPAEAPQPETPPPASSQSEISTIRTRQPLRRRITDSPTETPRYPPPSGAPTHDGPPVAAANDPAPAEQPQKKAE